MNLLLEEAVWEGSPSNVAIVTQSKRLILARLQNPPVEALSNDWSSSAPHNWLYDTLCLLGSRSAAFSLAGLLDSAPRRSSQGDLVCFRGEPDTSM